MPKVYKVTTPLGYSFELELLEKTRNVLVFREVKTGRLFKVALKKAVDGKYLLDVNGIVYSVFSSKTHGIFVNSEPLLVTEVVPVELKEHKLEERAKAPAATPVEAGVITSPIAGRVVEVKVKPGDKVSKGDVILLMESMKMIIEVKSDLDGVVEDVYVAPGKAVQKGDKLLKVKTS